MPGTNPASDMEAQNTTNPTDQAINDLDQVSDSDVQDAEGQGQEPQGQEGSTPAEDGQDGTPTKQDRRTNAEFARKRREAEEAQRRAEQQRLQQEAYNRGKIEGIGGVNPYTKEPIEDEEDLHDYEVMKRLDEEGKDPIAEFPKVVREERQARKKKLAEDAETKRKAEEADRQKVEHAKAGIAELEKAYPAANFDWFKDHYENDPIFRSLLAHDFSPLEAYRLCRYDQTEKPQTPTTSQRESTPSSVPGGSGTGPKPISQMTLEEYEEYVKERYGEEYA